MSSYCRVHTYTGLNISFSLLSTVVGFSVCNTVAFLQVVVDAVAELAGIDDSEAEGSTFSALEAKLESLLQDEVGGKPDVNITSSSNGFYSDLMIELTLNWTFKETKQLGLDLGELLAEVDVTGVEDFKQELLPPAGEAGIEVEGGLLVTLALGLEYSNTTKKVTPYVIGSTGMRAYFMSKGFVQFEASLGPLTGEVVANFTAGTKAMPLALQVGLNESSNYYLKDPNATANRTGFTYPGKITKILNYVEASFSGAASANIKAEVPLIFAEAEFQVTIADVNAVFNKTANATHAEVKKLTAGIPKPSFLSILLADPQAIVDALDNVLALAEDASLGLNGIVTKFDVPFIKGAIQNGLGAGTGENVLGQARQTMIPAMQETLNKYEEDSKTVADLLGVVITEVLQDLNLMGPENQTLVECFEYDNTTMTQRQLPDCTHENATSVQVRSCAENIDPQHTRIPLLQFWAQTISSVFFILQWTVPLGDTYSIEIPLDFSIDANSFPLKISMEGKPLNESFCSSTRSCYPNIFSPMPVES